MKKLVTLAVCLVSGLTAWAQGTIVFANAAPGVNAPVFDVDGTTRLAAGYVADLWYGPAGIAAGDVNNAGLISLGLAVPFRTGASAGYFLGGTQTFPAGTTGPASLQVRAWRLADGATWAAASLVGSSGKSQVIQAVLVNSPTPPNNLVGLASFNLVPVPEPSTFALGALGLAGLVLFRRRK